ncbi:MAG: SEC-C metal-binding domain-containing protein [Candidatus Latescibacterota bacterium]|nr:SEC-C metal-binding domain-containing protein [Candidatus Latescibacterota bacterium]
MRLYIANYIDDFIQSPHFELLPSYLKSHAETILQYLLDGLVTDHLDILRETLIDRTRSCRSRIILPENTYQNISQLVKCYFSYLDSSGNIPGALEWNTWVTSISQPDPISGHHSPATVRHKFKKTGRNIPCPCGSGLKFKKCCIGLLK